MYFKVQWTTAFLSALVVSKATASPDPSPNSAPFLREANLLAGVAQSGGDGLQSKNRPLIGFIYYRAFTAPQPGRFVLRMLADALLTDVTPSSTTPLSGLQSETVARAALVRFGFSGCYVPDAVWLVCMDDGPRVTWLNQGKQNAQVLGSFPLGVSLHSGHFYPLAVHARAEFGWWKTVQQNKTQKSHLNMFWAGAGYSW
jgi:hypothetical protein